MNDVSIGPEKNHDQPMQPNVDAQSETERDIERGLAGTEAKPFSEPGNAENQDAESLESKSDEHHSAPESRGTLISGRRNPGRE